MGAVPVLRWDAGYGIWELGTGMGRRQARDWQFYLSTTWKFCATVFEDLKEEAERVQC